MSYLYGGKILRVDLTSGNVQIVPTERYATKYVGARGTNARLLYEAVDGTTDPLGPENIVTFGTGPLTGTTFPGCSRTDVMCKSPVTNLIGDCSFGGDWSAELKNAGWDHVVLEGRSPHPVYVYIRNDRVEIRDARPYWGLPNYEAQAAIRADLNNPNYKIVSIGPGGENQVTFASIHSNIGNSGSRTGIGAVMGSKNCKAIVVRGTKGVAVADPEAFLEACAEAHLHIRGTEAYAEYHEIGLLADELAYVRCGIECGGDAHDTAPSFDDKFDYSAFWKRYGYKRTGCTGCPVHCMEAYNVPGVGATIISCELYPQLGAELRNYDERFWYQMVMQCHKQGLDNTSVATILQWLMTLWELGIIDESITGGYRMEWGNREAIEGIFWDIVHRRGFGDNLAQGMKAAADYMDARIPLEKRGGKSTYYHAMQVNNNPMYGIVGRFHGQALAYSVGRRSDLISDLDMSEFLIVSAPVYPIWDEATKQAYTESEQAEGLRLGGTPEAADPEGYKGKAALVHDMGMTIGLPDTVGTCKWHTKFLYMYIDAPHYAKALSAGLGRKVEPEELVTASLRMRNLERALECKMGRRRENDTIPEKEFDKKVAHGYWKGKLGTSREGLERMKSEYYLIRGWDLATGIPYKETLQEYGLEDVAQDLASLDMLPERSESETAAAMKDPSLAHILMDEEERRARGAAKSEAAEDVEKRAPEVEKAASA